MEVIYDGSKLIMSRIPIKKGEILKIYTDGAACGNQILGGNAINKEGLK